MKKLEDKIITKVFKIETERTFSYVLTRIALFTITVLLILFLSIITYEILRDQGSFDLIDFTGDDIEVVSRYLIDNIYIFYEETPKLLLFLTGMVIIGFGWLLIKAKSNYSKIRNKLISIYKFHKKGL